MPKKKATGSETARLKQQLKEKDKEIEILKQISFDIYRLSLDEILKKIIETAVYLTHCDACYIYLADKNTDELVLTASKTPHPEMVGKARLKKGEGFAWWTADHKKPLVVQKNAFEDPRFKALYGPPEDKYHAILSVPIMAGDEVVGVINVRHKKSNVYKESAISILFSVATQFGGAVANARLKDMAVKKQREIETLTAVSKSIVSGRYMEEVLNLIVSVTAELFGSKICSVMVLDEEKEELRIVATQSLSADYRSKPNVKVGTSIAGRAVKTKSAISVLDVTKEPGYFYGTLAKKEGLKSMLIVPMIVREKAVGVINIYTTEEHRFTTEETNTLQLIANQVAIGLDNMSLMEEALSAKEALESRKLVERAKGILMKKYGMTEDAAHKTIHKKSMDSRKSMKEIAEAIVLAAELEK